MGLGSNPRSATVQDKPPAQFLLFPPLYSACCNSALQSFVIHCYRFGNVTVAFRVYSVVVDGRFRGKFAVLSFGSLCSRVRDDWLHFVPVAASCLSYLLFETSLELSCPRRCEVGCLSLES